MKTLLLTTLLLSGSALSATHDGQNIDGHDFRCRGAVNAKKFHFNIPQPDENFKFGYDDDNPATCRFEDSFVRITIDRDNILGAFFINDAIDDPRFYAYTNKAITWYPDFPNSGEWLTQGTYKIFVYFDEEEQTSNFAF